MTIMDWDSLAQLGRLIVFAGMIRLAFHPPVRRQLRRLIRRA